ncbi:MAG: PorT family protein [Cyclobacteriaceae bacterium]|nr:PorT family protein [Cyclobacteriaceae bacterium]
MKKIVLLFTMIALINPVWAQLDFGIKGGLNLSKLILSDPEASYQSKTGYHAGIFFQSKFDKVAIQPEVLLYTMQGNFSGPGYTGSEDFTYLTIPVMLKFFPVKGMNLQLGPQVGMLLNGERSTTTLVGTVKQDIKDQYEKTDYSVSAGLGWDFSFGLKLDARYNIGIKDINRATNGEEAKSRVFLVSLGWNFLR